MAVLAIRELAAGRGTFEARLEALCLDAGESAALTGVSGSGKSTLLEGIGLISENVSAAQFELAGFNLNDASHPPLDLLRQAAIGLMPQSGGLVPFLSVADNIRLQLKLGLEGRRALGLEGRHDGARMLEAALELAGVLGIKDCLKHKAHQLSIGQRQRASFVRAAAHQPALLLIDEPTSALDPANAALMFKLIKEQCASCGIAALVVTHDELNVRDWRCCAYVKAESGASHARFRLKGET